MKKTLTIVTAILVSVFASAQYTTDKVVGDKKTELIDSLKKKQTILIYFQYGVKKLSIKGLTFPNQLALVHNTCGRNQISSSTILK